MQRVVADLYSGQMLSAVTDITYGLLSIPKICRRNTDRRLRGCHYSTENGKELKAWDAIARYMEIFEDTDGDGIANAGILQHHTLQKTGR